MNINEGNRFSQGLAPKLLSSPQFTVTSNYLIFKYNSWGEREERMVFMGLQTQKKSPRPKESHNPA